MLWWKLTLDSSGAILTCEQADTVEKNGKLTCFVQATTKADACSAAKAWHENEKKRSREKARLRRSKLKEKGLCESCGRGAPQKNRTRCNSCVKKMAEYSARHYRGEARPRLAAEEQYKNYLDGVRKRDKRRVNVKTVLEIFDKLGSVAFRAWLVETIEKGWADVDSFRVGQSRHEAAQAAEKVSAVRHEPSKTPP